MPGFKGVCAGAGICAGTVVEGFEILGELFFADAHEGQLHVDFVGFLGGYVPARHSLY